MNKFVHKKEVGVKSYSTYTRVYVMRAMLRGGDRPKRETNNSSVTMGVGRFSRVAFWCHPYSSTTRCGVETPTPIDALDNTWHAGNSFPPS